MRSAISKFRIFGWKFALNVPCQMLRCSSNSILQEPFWFISWGQSAESITTDVDISIGCIKRLMQSKIPKKKTNVKTANTKTVRKTLSFVKILFKYWAVIEWLYCTVSEGEVQLMLCLKPMLVTLLTYTPLGVYSFYIWNTSITIISNVLSVV